MNRKCIGFEVHREYISMFEERIAKTTKNAITKLTIDKNEYSNMTENEIQNKIQKKPKKHLLQLLNNENQYKQYSKTQLVNAVYSLYFMNTTG